MSAKTKKGLASYLGPLWHKAPFQRRNWTQINSLNTCRIFFMPYGTSEGIPLSFSGQRIGRREGDIGCLCRKTQQGLGGVRRSFSTSSHKTWGDHGEHKCRSGEVGLCTLCSTQFPSEGNSELSWRCLQADSGKTRFKRASLKTFWPLTVPSSPIYSVLDFRFPLFPFSFYFSTTKSKLGAACVFHFSFEDGTCKILSPVTYKSKFSSANNMFLV